MALRSRSRVLAAAFGVVALATVLPISLAQPQGQPSTHVRETTTHRGLSVEVHPGMELLAIMGFVSERYPTPMDSKYKSDVWAHFARFRQHPALAAFKQGIIYPDFTELGLLLDTVGFAPAASLDTSSWFASIGRERTRTLMQGVARFARDSRFTTFRRQHASMYRAWAARVETALSKNESLDSVRLFYRPAREEAAADVRLYLEPLNNWGAHQIDVTRAFGQPSDNSVRFQFGPSDDFSSPDSPLQFAMPAGRVAVVWHEAGHAYMRSFMAQHAGRVATLARLFDASDANLKRQNITTWEYAFEENVVRSVVAVLIGRTRGAQAMTKEIQQQAADGFVLVPKIAALLQQEYIEHRDRYPRFDDFGTRLLEMLQ